MVYTRPRDVPQIDVKLDEYIDILEYPLFVGGQDHNKQSETKETLTSAVPEYCNSIDWMYKSKDSDPTKMLGNQTVPKYYISPELIGTVPTGGTNIAIGSAQISSKNRSLINFGRGFVLRPDFFQQHTVLSKNSNQIWETTVPGSGPSLLSPPYYTWSSDFAYTTDGEWYACSSWVDVGDTKGFKESSNPSAPDRKKSIIHIQKLTSEMGASPKNEVLGLLRTLKSEFKLKTNQPFSIKFRAYQPTGVVRKQIEGTEIKGKAKFDRLDGGVAVYSNEVQSFYANFLDKGTASQTSIAIEWGNLNTKFSLTDFYNLILVVTIGDSMSVKLYTRRFTLSSSTTFPFFTISDTYNQIGSGTLSPTVDSENMCTIMIYPIGSTIFISNGMLSDVTSDSSNSKGVTTLSFERPEIMHIGEREVTASFWGGLVDFKFYPIVHAQMGCLLSPVFKMPAEVKTGSSGNKKVWLRLDYLGKASAANEFVAGCTTNSINFPHKYDNPPPATPIYDYLQPNCQIIQDIYDANRIAPATGTVTLSDAYGYYGSNVIPNADKSRYFKFRWYLISDKTNAIDYDDPQRRRMRIHSPLVYKTEFCALFAPTTVSLSPDPQIDNKDVLSINVNKTVEGEQCTIVLNNRHPDRAGLVAGREKYGKYTYISGTNNFIGVKPITVQYGYDKNAGLVFTDLQTQFRGFIVERQYQRPNASQSTVTLRCEDLRYQLNKSYSIATPAYDGVCHLAVMYMLAKEAGLNVDAKGTDKYKNQLVLWQDTVTGDSVTVRDELDAINAATTGLLDPADAAEEFRGTCFDGHPLAFPPPGLPAHMGNIKGSILHLKLENGQYREPLYMFQTGTSIWDCMQKVKEHSGFLLYINNWGNLVYTPIHADNKNLVMDATPVSKQYFYEVPNIPAVSDYNEIVRHFDFTVDSTHHYNNIVMQGKFPITNNGVTVGYSFGATTISKFSLDALAYGTWPNNPKDPTFIPFKRTGIIGEPELTSQKHMNQFLVNIMNRITRMRGTASWGAWGQPNLFPWDFVLVYEQIANETSINDLQSVSSPAKGFILMSIRDTLTNGVEYNTELEGEYHDSKKADFYPDFY